MASEVQTTARLAQWRFDHLGSTSSRGSKSFKIGIWRWRLSLDQSRQDVHIRLNLEPSQPTSLARFVIRLSRPGRNYISPIHERLLSTSEDFYWPLEPVFRRGCLIIQVEFLNLKIWSHGEARVVWPVGQLMRSRLTQNSSTGGYLARMLNQGLNADVTINAYGGSARAHKAVLRVASPVFDSMFRHNLKENESSTVNINDMSSDTLMALLRFLYEAIKEEEFFEHRSALLDAANKYGIGVLKEACEDSLLEDINSQNVLERLHEAWLYQLEKLKRGCLRYLFQFGRIEDVRDQVEDFFTHTHRDFMVEMFQIVPRAVWNPAVVSQVL